MKVLTLKTFLPLILSISTLSPNVFGQKAAPLVGSVKVFGQIQLNGKKTVLDRKRFYLIRGDLKQNQPLVERLKNAELTSRSCFFQAQNISREFACWLTTDTFNCESVYCREIADQDVNQVPEFKAAYDKGLKQFGGRKEIARRWLTTNLAPNLRDGFYKLEKTTLQTLLGDARPVQNTMTESVAGTALFVDIPLNPAEGKKTSVFTISNIVPFEIGGKSYVWACEAEVGAEKQVVLRIDNRSDTCLVFIKDLKTCGTGECGGAK